MPIPASYIVQVNVGTISAGANNLDFHGLMLTKNQTLPIGAVYSFADVSGVQEYFGYESDEASLATIYFLGYDGAFKMPTKLNFSRFADTAQAAWLRGASLTATVDELKSSVGTMTVTMNGANLLMIGQATGVETGMPESITWNGYTDEAHTNLVQVTFNATQFIAFWGYAETSHKNAILEQVRLLKIAVGEAESVEAVYAVVWPDDEEES